MVFGAKIQIISLLSFTAYRAGLPSFPVVLLDDAREFRFERKKRKKII